MKSRLAILVSALLFSAASIQASPAAEFSIKTPRGDSVPVIVDQPAGAGPHPAVVLAPGVEYHMRLPVMQKTADALVARGLAVYRFDWAYTAAKGKASEGRKSEVEDMKAVLDAARGNAAINKERILIGGKSMGSIVAWQVFRETPEAGGALLLTPICTSGPRPPGEIYAGFTEEKRASFWISGDRDSFCRHEVFYKFIPQAGGPVRVATVGGRHSFEADEKLDDDAAGETARTIALAADLTADFARTVLTRRSSP